MIQTPNLLLRPLKESDWLLFSQLHNDAKVIEKCFDPIENDALEAKFQARLTFVEGQLDTVKCLCILDKQGHRLGIGGFTLHEGKEREVGYLFLPSAQGKGYATEALNASIEFAVQHQGAERFIAVVSEGNTASMRVLEKCGFKLDRVVPNAFEIGGKKYDDYHFSLRVT
ncbi:Acetyltransferase [Pseudoalteromonas luteoviolacea B = ATCC 29581]|nr:Acetyltransferase [Pseudoalteromonas luteoviolacea B = ATCC 29581]